MHTLVTVLLLLTTTSFVIGNDGKIRVGILYSDPYSDGWTLQHDIARGHLEKTFLSLGYQVTTEVCIKCSLEETSRLMLDWTNRNFDIIFSTSGAFRDNTIEYMANSSTNATKLVTWGSPSLGYSQVNIQSKTYQGYYLAGIACGLITKTNKIGFVALQTTNNIPNIINSFTVGATKFNPAVKTFVTFTNAYHDPLLERRSGQRLIEEHGIDCLLGTVNASLAFEEAGLYSVGYNNDYRYLVGDSVLVSILPDWRKLYVDMTMAAINYNNSTWKSGVYATNFGQDMDLSNFSPTLPSNVRTEIWNARSAVLNGTDRIFCGPWAQLTRPDLFINYTTVPSDSTCLSHSEIVATSHIISSVKFLKNYTFDDVVENVFVKTSDGLGVAIYVTTVICLISAFLLIVDIIVYRNTTVYRPAQPLFCIIVIIGCIFGFTSVLSWTDEPTFSLCQLRIWLSGIGFSVAYGGIVMKNYRIWRIFSNKSLEIFAVTDVDLIVKGILPLLAGEVLILVLWTAIDPFVPTQVSSPLLHYYQFNKQCASLSTWPLAIFLVYNVLFLIAGSLVSFLTSKLISRRLNKPSSSSKDSTASTTGQPRLTDNSTWTLSYRFVESKFIGLTIYTTVLIGFCALAVLLTVNYIIEVSIGVISFVVIIFFASILGFVFVPKVKRLHIDGEKTLYSYQSSNNNNSITMTSTRHGSTSSSPHIIKTAQTV